MNSNKVLLRTGELDEAAVASPPRSPTRVMTILETLAQDSAGLSLARLCDRVGQPKTTLLSLLRALEAEGYVDHRQGLYRLGESALRLATLISASVRYPSIAHEHLVRLRDRIEEGVFMAVLTADRTHAVYVDKVESTQPLRYAVEVGTQRPLYCTAIGRVLLAYQPSEFIDQYLSRQVFPEITQATLTSSTAIAEQVVRVRERGAATVFDEHTAGVGACAVPVFGVGGELRGAISVAGPAERVRPKFSVIEAEVRDTAATLSRIQGAPT